MQRSAKMDVSGLALTPMDNGNIVEINDLSKFMKEDDPTKYNHAKIISLIIKLLNEGKQVIYNPRSMPGYNQTYYDLLLQDRTEKLLSMEFIFVPKFTEGANASSNYFFKPRIETNQAMMFRPSEILIKFLMMFLSLDDMSSYLNNGSYELMSRVRVGYLINKQKKVLANTSIKIGGSIDTNTDINLYDEGLDILYKGGRRRPLYVKRRSFKKMTRKILKRLRKSMQKRRSFKRRKSIKRAAKRTRKN
jgi:hypothetical protein